MSTPDPRATAVAEQLIAELEYPQSLPHAFAEIISAALADAKREIWNEAADFIEAKFRDHLWATTQVCAAKAIANALRLRAQEHPRG